MFVAWPIAELPRVRADIEGELMAVVDQVPELAERLRAGRREERFGGATQLPNFLRTPCGLGWALVGDVACNKDPYMALGICDALRDDELLAEATAAGLTGGRRWAFPRYRHARARDTPSTATPSTTTDESTDDTVTTAQSRPRSPSP